MSYQSLSGQGGNMQRGREIPAFSLQSLPAAPQWYFHKSLLAVPIAETVKSGKQRKAKHSNVGGGGGRNRQQLLNFIVLIVQPSINTRCRRMWLLPLSHIHVLKTRRHFLTTRETGKFCFFLQVLSFTGCLCACISREM